MATRKPDYSLLAVSKPLPSPSLTKWSFCQTSLSVVQGMAGAGRSILEKFHHKSHDVLIYGLSWWLSSKESSCNAGDVGSIPGAGRSPGGGNGNPLQHSCLENPMDIGAWQAIVSKSIHSRGASYVGCVALLLWQANYFGSSGTCAGPWSGWLPGPICTETAGCWWVGLGHKVTGYAALVPQASAGPLVSETGFQSQRLRGWENWI